MMTTTHQKIQNEKGNGNDDDEEEIAQQFMEATGPSVHYTQTPFFNAALLAHVPAAGELVLTPEVFAGNAVMAEKLRQGLERASRELFWRKLARADAILHAGGDESTTAALIGQILARSNTFSVFPSTAATFALWQGSRGAARRVRESYAGLCVNHADWFAAAWKTFRTIFATQSPSRSPSLPPSPAVAELFAMAVLFANGTAPRHLVFGALAVRGADIQMLAKLVHAVLISTGLLAGSFRGAVGRAFPGVVHKEKLLPPLPRPRPPPLSPSLPADNLQKREVVPNDDEGEDEEESVSRYVFDVLAAHLETTLAIYDGTAPQAAVSARWIRWAPTVYRTIAQFLAIYRGQIAILVCGHTSAEEPVFLGGAQDLAGILGETLFGASSAVPISRRTTVSHYE